MSWKLNLKNFTLTLAIIIQNIIIAISYFIFNLWIMSALQVHKLWDKIKKII